MAETTSPISPACLLLAVVSGSLKTLEAVVVAYPHQHAKQHNYKQRAASKVGSIVANLILTIGEVFTKIMAVGVGPVAIVVPIQISTNLLSNMLLQPLLGIASYSQNAIIGTLILVAAASMLAEVGPTDIDPEESVLDLIWSFPALVFLASTFTVMLASLLTLMCKCVSQNVLLVFLYAILGESAAVICTASTKIAQMDVPSGLRVQLIILYCFCSVIPTFTGACANAELEDPSLFVPIGAGSNLLLTALAGLFLWEDAQRLAFPFSYGMIYIIVVLSCYLVSKDDVLGIIKCHVAEAHIKKVRALTTYAECDFYPLAPRGRLARVATCSMPLADPSSELASPRLRKCDTV